MIDIKLIRENPEIVKENIKKKFQDEKLPLVDEVAALDKEFREAKTKGDALRGDRNRISKEIGKLMGQGLKDEAEKAKQQVKDMDQELLDLEEKEGKLSEQIKQIMMTIPNIIDESVPIGRDDSENVEIEKFGEPVIPDYEIPYHTDLYLIRIIQAYCNLHPQRLPAIPYWFHHRPPQLQDVRTRNPVPRHASALRLPEY